MKNELNQSGGRTAFVRLLAWTCLCMMLSAVRPAFAQDVNYSVDIRGAGNASRMLEQNLDITLRSKEPIAPDELQRLFAAAPKRIRDLLATEGYFTPKIVPTLQQSGERWRADFAVDPGPPSLIDTVEIRFSGAIASGPAADQARMQALRSDWSLQAGDRFRQADWDRAKGELLKDLLARDFPAAKFEDSAALVNPETHRVNLQLDVDSGPAFSFGALEINGLKRYGANKVQALNPIVPGEAYSQEKLTELQARLQDSGYFLSVFATIEVDPAQPRNVPVRVDLTENPRRRLSAGAGYSTDGGPRLQAKWLDRNFLGRDLRLDSELRLERQTSLLAGELTFPARPSGWIPSLGSRFERSDINNEQNDKFRLDARYSSPLRRDQRTWGVSYLTERQHLPAAAPNNRQALVATFSQTWRRLDNLLNPTRGWQLVAEAAAGPKGLLNEANIVRLNGRGNYLRPLGERWQFVARGQLGQVFFAPRERVPSDLLFRAGGDASVRGYGYNSLGVEQAGAIVGGRVLAVASAEIVYQATPRYGIALFHDAGNATDSWKDFRAVQGTGVGARVTTPIGPVKIDLAYGHETRKPRLHFSVGYGF